MSEQTVASTPEVDYEGYVAGLVKRAREAQRIAEGYDQARVDELCAAVSFAATDEEFRKKAARMLVDESKMGVFEDKFNKIWNKATGVWRDMKDEKSVGIIEEDPERNLVTYCKPMGVIAAILPVTNGEATPIVKSLWTLKARDAIIFTPHKRAKYTGQFVVNYVRKVLKQMGAPEDLVICIDPEMQSRDTTAQLMKQCDFIVATGGSGLVKAAYSSGTPAIGVGAGNDTTYIDTSADLADAANKLMRSQVFDNSSSCSSENNVIAHKDVYEAFIKECEKVGGYVIRNDSPDKEKIVHAIYPTWPEKRTLNRDTAAQNVQRVAEIGGFSIPDGTKFIMIEELDGVGKGFVTTTEKLCPVVSIIPADSFEDAMSKMTLILENQGNGHAAGIHTKNQKQVEWMGEHLHVARILVNQPQALGNSGAFFNGLPITMSLGCSTWGGNSTSRNITWHDIVNTTTVSREVSTGVPKIEDLYPENIRAMKFEA